MDTTGVRPEPAEESELARLREQAGPEWAIVLAETHAWVGVRQVGTRTHVLAAYTLEDLGLKIDKANGR